MKCKHSRSNYITPPTAAARAAPERQKLDYTEQQKNENLVSPRADDTSDNVGRDYSSLRLASTHVKSTKGAGSDEF